MSGALLLLAAVAAAVGVLALALETRRQWHQRRYLGAVLQKLRVADQEQQREQAERARLHAAQSLAEAGVAGVTDIVRSAHLGIAAIPFGLLEALPPTREATRAVRSVHDAISNAVYGSIAGVNRGVGLVGRALLKPSAAKAEPPALPGVSTPATPPDE